MSNKSFCGPSSSPQGKTEQGPGGMRKRKEEGQRSMWGRGPPVLADAVMLGHFSLLAEAPETLLFEIMSVGMEHSVRLEDRSSKAEISSWLPLVQNDLFIPPQSFNTI